MDSSYMTTSSKADIFQRAFPNLDQDAVEILGQSAQMVHYPVGSEICHQGDLGTELFVMAEGKAAVFVRADVEGNEVMVNTMVPPNYFGEMALLVEDTVRSATIRAVSDSQVYTIDRDTFWNVADQNPTLLRRLARQLTMHLRNNDRAVIAELREKNHALEAAYEDLAAQEQIRSEFVTTLSHELRTPLTSIQGFLQLINNGVIKGESIPVALNSITRNVEKLIGMTNNLLVLYEMQLTAPEYTDFVLAELLMSAIHKTQEKPEFREANISIEIAPAIPVLRGDMAGLTLAVHALIENAIKFSPAGSPVEICVSLASPQDVRIEVKDSGIGIPAKEQERIFDPFYRLETDSDSQLFAGVGIGLSIAKFIVERHHGTITVHSDSDAGTTFAIELPLRPRATDHRLGS